MAENASDKEEAVRATDRRPHPFQLALLWRQQTKEDARLNRAKIAATEGVSRARVTQIMDLLQLPAAIQNGSLRPPVPLEMDSSPERRLRNIVRCENEEAQIARWQELLRELADSWGE